MLLAHDDKSVWNCLKAIINLIRYVFSSSHYKHPPLIRTKLSCVRQSLLSVVESLLHTAHTYEHYMSSLCSLLIPQEESIMPAPVSRSVNLFMWTSNCSYRHRLRRISLYCTACQIRHMPTMLVYAL